MYFPHRGGGVRTHLTPLVCLRHYDKYSYKRERTRVDSVNISLPPNYYYYYYYYKCHGLECCQLHSYGGTLQKSRIKTVAQLNSDVF